MELNPDGISVKGCSYIYAPRGQAGEYAALSANPYRGCGHKCAYCLDPNTLIQMADGRSLRLVDVQIGEDIIGVSPSASRYQSYAVSRVLNKVSTRKLAFRVTLDDGHSAVCSGDHRWLTERGWKYTTGTISGEGQRPYLTTSNSIQVFNAPIWTPEETTEYRRGYLSGMIRGDGNLKRYDYSGQCQRAGRKAPQRTDVQHHFRLALKDIEALDRSAAYLTSFGITTDRFEFSTAVGARAPMTAIRNHNRSAFEAITALITGEPVGTSEWLRGWLAGIFDAEGSANAVLRVSNGDPDILATTERAFAHFGFKTIRDVPNALSGVLSIRLLGGLPAIARFFNLTAPAVSRKFPAVGATMKGSSRVVAIEPLGYEINMLDITTSTENFIANGMVSHNCYVPRVLKMDRQEFDVGATIRPAFEVGLAKDAAKYKALGVTEQVMLSFTTDPYPPQHHMLTRWTLETLQASGLAICTLTKGGKRALRDIGLFRPNRDAFASTLTSLDATFSRKWERGAADPDDRISTLRAFHDRGIFTWVSLEPTIDCDASLAIVDATHEFVDLYKVGRVNYVGITKTTDWADYTWRMIDKLRRLGKAHYIKKDLQPFLPAGYHNPLRVPQHH